MTTPGAECDRGSKYELSVRALFASLLSKDENVEDYRIFANLADAHPFDDLVAEVQFKGCEQKQIYAVQIKSGKDKSNINEYCDGYNKIIRQGGLKLGKSVRNDRISFWYFCNKTPARKKTFTIARNAATVDLTLQLRSRPYNLHEIIFNKAVSHRLFSEDSYMADHQNFFENFYLLFTQPDTGTIINIIKGIWKIDEPRLILQYLDSNLAKSSNGLDKATFEHKLLHILLSEYIVTPIAAIALQRKAVDEWNRLTLEQDVTIVQNDIDIERYLFGCILQNISDLISIEKWNQAIDNLGKLDLDLKAELKAKSFKADTLGELMFKVWVARKAPLLLKTDAPLLLLKQFSHLKKCYVIIDSNVGKRYKEIHSYELSAFRHLGDVEAYGLTNVISVSLQGRKPVSLNEVISDDGELKKTIACLDIINLIKPRAAHLKRGCSESCDYMLFLIETADLQQLQDNEHHATASNIAIYCGLDESESNYTKYRLEPRYKNYKILRIHRTDDDKLKLIPRTQEQYEEEYRGLECFFVDQNGESVYYMADGTIVPVIGEVPIRTDAHFGWKYVSRYLHKGIKKDEARSEDASSKFSIGYAEQMLAEKDFFTECSGKINVITGEPGMGKTALLHSLFGFCESKYYVLFVDLARIQGDLLSGKLKSCQRLLDLSRDKCHSLPYSCLLNSLHGYPNRLVLILDSFDEIVAICKQQVLELVKSVQGAELQNVIIASRLTALNLLVDNCEAKIFKVKGLSKRSDKHYIDNWNLDINKLRHIPSRFLTTPLYLRMLTTLSENGMDLEVVSSRNLYESVLKLKINDYCLRNCLDEDEKQSILTKHGELALKTVFGINKVTKKLKVQPNNSNFIRLGFITHVNDGSPVFVHRTFAEFFVVKWIIQNVGREDTAYIYRLMLDNGDINILGMYVETFPLHEAILEYDIDEIRRLCEEDTKCLMKTDDIGRSALHIAASLPGSFWSTKILNFLLPRMRNEGCDIYARDKIMEWRWIDYYEHTNKVSLYRLYANGWKPLVFAIITGRKDVVQMLLDGINFKSKRGTTPLCVAIRIKNADIVQILLDHQVDVNSVDEYGMSPLITAAETGDSQIAEMLLNKGADVNFKNEYGVTALYAAAFKRNTAMVELLLEHGADVNVITFSEQILRKAKSAKKLEVVIWLLKNRNRKVRLLSSALYNSTTNIIEMVTEDWARINLQNELRAAIHQQLVNSNTIEILMEWGGKIDIEDEFWKIVFYLVSETNNTKVDNAFFLTLDEIVIGILIRKVCGAASHANLDIIKIFSRHHENCFHILLTAIAVENNEIVRILLQNADIKNLTSHPHSFLHIAVRNQNIAIIEMLLEHGFATNLVNDRGVTPLLLDIDHVTICGMWLAKNDANLNFQIESTGITALHIAALKENRAIVRKLLEHGANKDVEIPINSLPSVIVLTKSRDKNASCNVSEIINKVKRIIEEESTGIEPKRSVSTKTWFSKIWHRYKKS